MKQKYLPVLLAGLSLILIQQHCGKSPSGPPLPLKGAIRTTAQMDTVPADSFLVILDNVPKGIQPNGCILDEIEAGRHQLILSKKDPYSPIDYSSMPRWVLVNANETTNVELALTKFAPNFSLKNLDEQDVSLDDYQGKVVLLIFFSHT